MALIFKQARVSGTLVFGSAASSGGGAGADLAGFAGAVATATATLSVATSGYVPALRRMVPASRARTFLSLKRATLTPSPTRDNIV